MEANYSFPGLSDLSYRDFTIIRMYIHCEAGPIPPLPPQSLTAHALHESLQDLRRSRREDRIPRARHDPGFLVALRVIHVRRQRAARVSIVCRSDLERGESPAGRSLSVFGYRGALPLALALLLEGKGGGGACSFVTPAQVISSPPPTPTPSIVGRVPRYWH